MLKGNLNLIEDFEKLKELDQNSPTEFIEKKLEGIKLNYFKNIFNKEFIKESYEFIEKYEILDVKNSKYFNENSYYLDILLFKQIQNLYLINNNTDIKCNKENLDINFKQNKNFEEKKSSNLINSNNNNNKEFQAKKFKENENLLIDISTNNKNNLHNENNEKSNNLINTLDIIDPLHKKFSKESNKEPKEEIKDLKEEEQKEKELEDIELRKKLNTLKEHYEIEELGEIYKILEAEEEELKKKKESPNRNSNYRLNNLKSLFLKENNINQELFNFEQKTFIDFKSLLAEKSSYIKLSSKDFELSYKLVNNQLYLRIAKEMDINIVDLTSLIYETSFYPLWFPFTKSTEMLSQPSKSKKLVYLLNSFPVVADRDFMVYGFGLNSIKENNVMYLLVRSVTEEMECFKDIIKRKESKKYVRADLNIFGFEMKIINGNKLSLNGVINTDPKVSYVPQWLINQAVKQFAKMLFSKMVSISKNYKGSKYENKNPSEYDKKFYGFINKEIKKNGF